MSAGSRWESFVPISSPETLAPSFAALVASTLQHLDQARAVERLWARDHRLWKPEPREISDRLGWLTVHEDMRHQLAQLAKFVATAQTLRIKDVVLLGMGGSSLGPEVLRASFGRSTRGLPRLWVLDSTVPGWVRLVSEAILPDRTLFLVASKSGGTIEVMSLFAHFWKVVTKAKGTRGGNQFVAITDPGTSLEALAREHGFAQVFTNPPDIGGRYSVLSFFGLVPAALLGLDVARLLTRAAGMADRCRTQGLDSNPGAFLGAAMGALAKAGRDKVTVMTSPALSAFGLWVEQLLAESTGKEGTGLIPVAQEPALTPSAYGHDRFFVSLRLKGDANGALDRQVKALSRAGHPVLPLTLGDRYDLAAEFFRWEFATAVAGHVLGIHPFDQPNVQESKDRTKRVLEIFKTTGRLPQPPTLSPAQAAQALSSHLQAGTYISLLGYTTPSRQFEAAVRRFRKSVAARHHVATTFGYGPRYLHSTGQLHKGGPNTGVFLELIDRMKPDVPIPGQPFTFGTLARAQAVGDLESLRMQNREAVQVQLASDAVTTLNALTTAFCPSPSPRRRRTRHG